MRTFLLALLCAVFLLPCAYGKDIHKEKSLYRNILVKESNGLRCLVFTVKRGDRNQTCMDLSDPKRLVFPYVRMSFGGLLLNDNPSSILIVGLGGGSIPVTLTAMFPAAEITIVEIDPAVLRVAERFFDFKETQNMKVELVDARVFAKRAGLKGKTYDFIILDAFTGDYIPEHLMTAEFLSETQALLTDDGVLVANTFSTSKLYDHESVTYQQVFGDYLNFKMANTGNRVIIASQQPLPSKFYLRSKAKQFAAMLDNYGVDIMTYPNRMSRKKDWDASSKPLTDQFNPANLLQGGS
ncbi:MAG: fused MFS/spermidine synthase [Pseudomonadales bacterium]|nr:fused MFS/spermidine synthase [Pseudomonadales bacterium]MDG1442813.1 fused MFS/spermidine synthase [Pseudomonadales bacterium]